MPRTKAEPKTEIAPMVSLDEFHALRDRVNQLESEKDRLVQEIHILKKIPADLTTQQSILNRHTERLDFMTASVGSVTQRLEALPAPKPKKRFVII